MTATHGTSEKSHAASISVVVAVYGGGKALPLLVDRLASVLSKRNAPYEIILVNDASPDESWSVIETLCAQRPTVLGIDLVKNAGQHNALLCGIRAAQHMMTVTMDDDLQHPPEHIPEMEEKLREGYDLVYCNPLVEPRSFIRNLLSRVVKRVVLRRRGASGVDIGSFRIFRTSVRDAFGSVHHPRIYLDLLLSWGARRTGEIRLPQESRRLGASTYTPSRLIRHALNMLTSFSVMPLHVASWIGFVFMLFGSLILLVTLADFLVHGRVVPGFTFLASILSIFSGAQLFSVGILGLYIARMYEGMLASPEYVIRQRVGACSSSRETPDS